MYKNNKILATICARGGSQGVKLKNIKKLGNKPLIIHSLELIKRSNIIDQYIVSTDSEKIMNVVKEYGFEIHFKRPYELASGKISRIDVIQHATKWVEENFGEKFDVIIDLGVATPLKNVNDMEQAIKILIDEDAPNVFSVNLANKSPYFNMVEERNGKIQYVKQLPEKISDRRDSPIVYEMNDGFNVFQHDILFTENPQFNDNTKISIMPHERSIDIDEEWDFLLAEFIIKSKFS